MIGRVLRRLRQRLASGLPRADQTPPGDQPTVHYAIDQFVIFGGMIRVTGWIWDAQRELASLALHIDGVADLPVADIRLPSRDVAIVIDRAAERARFKGQWFCDADPTLLVDAVLIARFADGSETRIDKLGARGLVHDQALPMIPRFFDRLREARPGMLLEVGSRARSGVSRKGLLPSGWRYTGVDVMAGDNVDVVGDAHRLSEFLPRAAFDAVLSVSVLEHLLMPWKFVVELNRVLAPGALGLFTTHQCWPMHDRPWDFWRFSADAWAALLNRATGFEIIERHMGEPAFVVANNCHAVTNFAATPAGYLSSTVLFRKVGDTALDWDVQLRDVLDNSYPSDTSDVRG